MASEASEHDKLRNKDDGAKTEFELPRLKQVEDYESCDLRLPKLEVRWHAKLRPLI